ncbi:Vinx1 [Hyposoter didymator ichnovirus]|nr:Vinx1 [Hyposoter didymator ichnovirus]
MNSNDLSSFVGIDSIKGSSSETIWIATLQKCHLPQQLLLQYRMKITITKCTYKKYDPTGGIDGINALVTIFRFSNLICTSIRLYILRSDNKMDSNNDIFIADEMLRLRDVRNCPKKNIRASADEVNPSDIILLLRFWHESRIF